MDDLISRQAAIEAIDRLDIPEDMCVFEILSHIELEIGNLPSAQQERIIYGNMSDEEFEKWLYGHGICNPNIRESIPCDAVPLLIDNAISELPSAQPEIIRCKDCGHFHYDMPYVIQGVPVLGHEVCDFWGDGCKTSENGYCSFAERREDERPES